jgi:hypothetical protein
MIEPTDNETVKNSFTFKRFLKCVGIALKWFLVILFVESLVVGFVLRIPWKIFFVFFCLTGLVFIPKRFRKYSYISVIILLVICNIWVLVPDKDRRWMPFRFDVEFAEFESKRIVPDQSNAAVIYRGLIDKYGDSMFHPSSFDFNDYNLDFNEPFSTENYPELSKMITDQQYTITTLLKAAEYDKCYFAIPNDLDSIKYQHRRLFVFKWLSNLLLHSANNDIGDNRFDQAITKQFALLKMADHLYQQRTLFDNSAAISIELMALENINRFIMQCCTDPAEVDRIASQLKLTDEYFPNNWPDIYDSLKLLGKNMVAMLYEVHPDGRIRRSHNIGTTVNRLLNAKMRISSFYMTIIKAGTVAHWFVLPSTPQTAAGIIDTAFDYYSPTSSADMSMPSRPKLHLNYKYFIRRNAYYCGKWYYAIETQSKTRISANRATTILCAIKKYHLKNNRFPESLDDLSEIDSMALTDSANGEAFVYRRTGDDFLLYSTGRNRIDENGMKMPILKMDDVRAWPPEPPEVLKLQ